MAVKPLRRVLIFAYFFPPLGGAGVQRIAKFAKYLPEQGWLPTVVTVRARDYWMSDPSLEGELGSRVAVVRTRSLTGLALMRRLAPAQAGRKGGVRSSAGGIRRLRGLASWVLIPDSYVGWVPYAVRAGDRLLREQRYDCILTTSSPDSVHLIGRALARRHRVPWIADFRDPWTRRLSFRPPTPWHLRRQLALEAGVLRSADLITVTADETRSDYLDRNPWLGEGKIRVVTNGYDEEDFAPFADERPPRDGFRVLHAGQLNPERPVLPFLEGLAAFLRRRPEARNRLKVRFIGPFYAGDLEATRRLGLGEIVSFEPGRPHREVVRELLRSHLLLLLEQGSERGGLILPGKVFEYLRSHRPILGLLPHGAAWRLVSSLQAGRCCPIDDTGACADALEAFDDAYLAGGPPPTAIDPDRLAAFERRALTGQLADLLGEVSRSVTDPRKSIPE